jgi:hypothetical protein
MLGTPDVYGALQEAISLRVRKMFRDLCGSSYGVCSKFLVRHARGIPYQSIALPFFEVRKVFAKPFKHH